MSSILPLFLALLAQANINPNVGNKPQLGWGAWQPKSQVEAARFASGFSNIELGGYLDFQNACQTETGLPEEKIDYWFRLSNSVQRIGTGKVETGCWYNDRFLYIHTSTAVTTKLDNVTCLQVNTLKRKSLIVRAEPRANSRRRGMVKYGQTVKPDSFPANIFEGDSENWISIVSPVRGWVSDGSFASSGNLKLCSAK